MEPFLNLPLPVKHNRCRDNVKIEKAICRTLKKNNYAFILSLKIPV